MQTGPTVTRTLRLDERVDKGMRDLAEEERVSVSHLANRALERFLEWDVHADKFGFVALPRDVARRLMTYLTDEEIREVARWEGKTVLRGWVSFRYKELSLATVLQAFPRLLARYAGTFEYEESHENGRHVIVIKHGRGPKWSLYYQELAKGLFEDFLKKEIRTDVREDVVTLQLPGP